MNDMEQRTDEWYAARLGKVTASSLYKVLAKTKTGYGADRANYMTQLVLERVSQFKADSYINAAMQWGIDQEPFARAAYEASRGVLVEEVAFLPHPTIEMAGASPDGLVSTDGMVEIKCPEIKTTMESWLQSAVGEDYIESKYRAQMQWQMRCADRAWCDYVIFDSRMPPKAQLLVTRVQRDDEWLKKTEQEVIKFLDETAAKTAAFRKAIGE
jgi:putative phage-type endonuclease